MKVSIVRACLQLSSGKFPCPPFDPLNPFIDAHETPTPWTIPPSVTQ